MDYDKFLESLVRIACKGKAIFNGFAKNIGKDGGDLNQTNVNDQAAQNADAEDKNNETNNDGQDPENKELEGDKAVVEKYKKLVDDYGNVKECTARTIECLIYYLALPEDKLQMDNRFRYILE